MEAQSGVENQLKKTKTNRKKSKFQKIIENSLSVDDSFSRLLSSENFTGEISSKDSTSIHDQTRSSDATCDSCCCNIANLDGTISSTTDSCSSFQQSNSRPCKNLKRISVLKKKRYENLISQVLQDSLDRGLDIPEDDETVDHKLEIANQERTGNQKSVMGSKSDNSDKAVMAKVKKSYYGSLKVDHVSKIDIASSLDGETLLIIEKEVAKKSITGVGVCSGLESTPLSQTSLQMKSYDSSQHSSQMHVSFTSKGLASDSQKFERFPLSPVNRIVRSAGTKDTCGRTDASDYSVGEGFADASVQADLCDCPGLIGFPCSAILIKSGQQNLSNRSERNQENIDPGNKFSALGNPLDKTGKSKHIVPTSTDAVHSMAKLKTMIASLPRDGNGVKAKNNMEYASNEDLSQIFSRVGLSDCSKTHPDKSMSMPSEVSTLSDANKTGSEALDGNEDYISPNCSDFSLQVSFASDGIAEDSLSGEHPEDEMAATGSKDVKNLLNYSGAASDSNETILYLKYNVSETTDDESIFGDKAEKGESADRAPMRSIKTEVDRRVADESGFDLECRALEVSNSDSAGDDSLTHDPKTDYRSISLQVSISSEEAFDESEAADRLESVRSERFKKQPEGAGDSLAKSDDDDDMDNDDDTYLREDLIVSESPLSLAPVVSSSMAAEDGEQMEQARNERQTSMSIDSPSECSLARSLHDVSLQVSLSSGDSNDTPAEDLNWTKDHDRKDRDHDRKDRDRHPLVPSRNPICSNRLFDLSDEEQSVLFSPDDCNPADPVDHRLSEVPGRDLCSTLLGCPSLESARSAHVKWVLSPIAPDNPSRRRSKSMRMVSLFASKKEERRRSSGSYTSAEGSALVVPDTSESSAEGGTLYKTAFGGCDAEGEFVADSPESEVDKSKGRTTQVISISNDSESSSSDDDDDDFENFLKGIKSTEKISKFSPPSLDGFVVDDSEVDEEEEEAAYDDGIIGDDVRDDDQIFYYQVDNERERCDINALSNRLGKVLDFSLTSDSSDDDFQKVVTKRKVIVKKPGKGSIFPLEDDKETAADKDGASIFITPAPDCASIFHIPTSEDGGIFRTPAPVVPKRRVLSVLTPKVSSDSAFSDKTRVPYTVGHAPAQRFSFLKSLSTDVKEFQRDPKAARYVKNFKSLRQELTSELFTLFNQEVFDSKIPSDMNVIWNERLRRTAGFCRSRLTRDDPPKRLAQIELSVKVCDSSDRLRDTLIHEMCHAVVWVEHGSREVHGPIWKSWAMKANRALPDLPLITRCHSYDISTKFIYKCTKCGYEIGRHSKSLDTDKKICGHCRGQFELLVRPRPGSRLDSAPSTPRTPNKFALFVKENYGDIRKTQPGMKHKEIMAMIGASYSAKKEMLSRGIDLC